MCKVSLESIVNSTSSSPDNIQLSVTRAKILLVGWEQYCSGRLKISQASHICKYLLKLFLSSEAVVQVHIPLCRIVEISKNEKELLVSALMHTTFSYYIQSFNSTVLYERWSTQRLHSTDKV